MTLKNWESILLATAILGGCSSGSTSSVGGQQMAVPPATRSLRPSWMEHGASNGDLLYVTNFYGGDVTVYSYPGGKLVGTLSGFGTPTGDCSDSAGNVFVTDYQDGDVVEYAHGGTTPIATLDDSGLRPEGCSVDPTTGDLAVSNLETNNFHNGDLAIYRHAKGTPKMYTNPNFFYYYFCAYDDVGNAYVSGSGPVSVYLPQVAVLEARGGKLKSIKFNPSLSDARGIAWDGSDLAIDQVTSAGEFVARFQISGATAKLIGTTPLERARDVNEFWIGRGAGDKGTKLIAPNFDARYVAFYNYPAGGQPIKRIRQGVDASYGTTISRGQIKE